MILASRTANFCPTQFREPAENGTYAADEYSLPSAKFSGLNLLGSGNV